MYKLTYKILRFIKQEVVLYTYYYMKNNITRKACLQINVKSIDETINTILINNCSVSRFGDGEFRWIIGEKQNSFQDYSEKMKIRLKEVISSSQDNHIVCLVDAFGDLKKYNRPAKRYWMEFMSNYRRQWIQLLDTNKDYYNSNVTRLYMDYKDKSNSNRWFELVGKLWSGRDVVIVEGEKTRLGVGNDLFCNVKSIRRILAPATNAFNQYDEILECASKIEHEALILIALGPTATILAYDLSKLGYQAIDVGHVDIEYEWLLMGAKTKVPVKNKYVNEASQLGGIDIDSINDNTFNSQIIEKIL